MESAHKTTLNAGVLVIASILLFLLVLPLFLRPGWISLVTEMLILGLAGSGLNLMLGYGGMVSFGPAGLYAVGAYTTALLLINTTLPFGLAFLAGPLAAGIVSIAVGWFSVRLTHVYFSLLTLAFSQIIHTIIFEWYAFTKGDDGIVGIPVPPFLRTISSYYYFTFIVVGICLALLWMIIRSPFGKTLQAIRENKERMGFIGINIRLYQLSAFVLSSCFLGVAGSLFCSFNRNVFPAYADMMKSAEMVVVCLLGGSFSFLGPLVGAVVYIFLDKIVSTRTEYWPLVLGSIIIFLLLFLKGGIVGYIDKGVHHVRRSQNGERDISAYDSTSG